MECSQMEKRMALKRTFDFTATKPENRDVYGQPIVWKITKDPFSYWRDPKEGPHHHWWYKYKNIYGPMIIHENRYKEIIEIHTLPPADGDQSPSSTVATPIFAGNVRSRMGVEAYTYATRTTLRERDRIAYENDPKSYEERVAAPVDPNAEMTWYERRTGRKPPREYRDYQEDVFHVSYLSSETMLHPKIEEDVNIPEGHYLEDDLIAAFNKNINAKIFQMMVNVHASAALRALKNDYVNFRIHVDKKTEEPIAECPFQAPIVTEKRKFTYYRHHNMPDTMKLTIKIKFTPTMQYILGLSAMPSMDMGPITLTNDRYKSAEFEIDLKRNPISTLWIFCDVVKPTLIKDTTGPLLRCMAVDRRSTQQISYEASHNMHYKPVCTSQVQRIKIWLSDSYLAHPMRTKATTFIRLEFVKL